MLGVSDELFRYGLLLFSGFPLSIIYNFIENPPLKHLFSIITSFALTVLVFSFGTLVSLARLCVLIYAIVSVFKTNKFMVSHSPYHISIYILIMNQAKTLVFLFTNNNFIASCMFCYFLGPNGLIPLVRSNFTSRRSQRRLCFNDGTPNEIIFIRILLLRWHPSRNDVRFISKT